MLGRYQAAQDSLTISRFESRRAGALLAYLALHRDRRVAREELIELLWPEADFDMGRNRFKQALASLRRQLEPLGTPWGAVLFADRTAVGLNAAAVRTDVGEFETALARANRFRTAGQVPRLLAAAIALYNGDLLPGYNDFWILAERERLRNIYLAAVQRLVETVPGLGEATHAILEPLTSLAADLRREESPGRFTRLHTLVKQFVTDLADKESRSAALTEPIPADSPPVLNARLPLQFTRFFGREEELACLQALLGADAGQRASDLREERQTEATEPPAPGRQQPMPGVRLVTLTGSFGSGKTRLAIEAARQAASAYAGAVWFVGLADITDARLLPGVIADALRLERVSQMEPLRQVTDFLNERNAPTLLVLDNFEQLADAGALILWDLLNRVPLLTCLVTSRRRLALAGEHLFPVASLPVPAESDTPADLMQFASVQLFADRVRAARPDFQVTPCNAAQVAALCQTLEGIPLAIELAASRAQMFTPAQMLAQIRSRFALLTHRRTDTDSRHRSLWVAIAWSYDLLSPELQRFFRRLSIFRSGWNLAAAQAVCAETRALDYLTQLRGHSLIVLEEGREEMRFRLLDSLREFGVEQLVSEEQAELIHSHAAYYRHLATAAETHLRGPDQVVWLERLEQECDNLRAALAAVPVEEALPMAAALGTFWQIRGPLSEGRQWLEAILARTTGRTRDRARALYFAGDLAGLQDDIERATALLDESLAISRELGDVEGIADVLHTLGVLAFYRGEYARALPLQEEALALRRELGCPWKMAQSLNGIALLVWRHWNDLGRARALLAEAVQCSRAAGDRRLLSYQLYNLANMDIETEDYARAMALIGESRALCRELDDRSFHAQLIDNLGRIATMQGDYARALPLYAQSLALCQQTGNQRIATYTLWGMSLIAHAGQDFAHAVYYLAVSERLTAHVGLPLTDDDLRVHERCLAEARAALGEKKTQALWQQGCATTLETVSAYHRPEEGRHKRRKKQNQA